MRIRRALSLTRLAGWLARRAVVLAPEQFGLNEGLRAAVITALALMPALYWHEPTRAWIAFGAFWTCLLDPGGHVLDRAKLFGGFCVGGVVAAWLGAVAGGLGLAASAFMVLLVGLGSGLARSVSPGFALLAMLVGAVGVAGIGFPRPPYGALEIAENFGGGCLFASFVCLWVWRIRAFAPAWRAMAAVFRLLARMGEDVTAGTLREAVHRQAIRSALEQARSLATQLDAAHGRELTRRQLGSALICAERLFTALLAIEHVVECYPVQPEELRQIAALPRVCREIAAGLARGIVIVPALPRELPDGALHAPAVAAWEGLGVLGVHNGDLGQGFGEDLARPRGRLTPAIWRHALRLTLALLATQIGCVLLHLDLAYWALIAALLVAQPSGRQTTIRSLERSLGSIMGAVSAALMVGLLPMQTALVAGSMVCTVMAIALRAVNYTLFVWFLTALFIFVAELVSPGGGFAWLRVEDNILGSAMALLCVRFVWPERGEADGADLVRQAAVSSLRYGAAILRGMVASPELDALQRAAGLATIRAEYAGVGLPLLLGGGATPEHREVLRLVRRLGGEVTVRRFDILDGVRGADVASADVLGAAAERLVRDTAAYEAVLTSCLAQVQTAGVIRS